MGKPNDHPASPAPAGDDPGALSPPGGLAIRSATPAGVMLSPPQQKALNTLASGQSILASAEAAGVNRTTLYRWLKTDPDFVAAYNTWRQEAVAAARSRLLALTDLAVTTVSNAMSTGDARTALAVLKATGALDKPRHGPTDPAEVRRIQAIGQANEPMQFNLEMVMGSALEEEE